MPLCSQTSLTLVLLNLGALVGRAHYLLCPTAAGRCPSPLSGTATCSQGSCHLQPGLLTPAPAAPRSQPSLTRGGGNGESISSLSAQRAGWGDRTAGEEGARAMGVNFRYLLAPRGSEEKQSPLHCGAVASRASVVTPTQGRRPQLMLGPEANTLVLMARKARLEAEQLVAGKGPTLLIRGLPPGRGSP